MKKIKSFLVWGAVAASLTLGGCQQTADDEFEVLPNQLVRGDWVGKENCGGAVSGNYHVLITNTSMEDNAVLINNIYDYGIQAKATVSGTTFTIPAQKVETAGQDEWEITGSGSVEDNAITFTFKLTEDGEVVDECSWTGTK